MPVANKHCTHAGLMMAYSRDAAETEKPWERWEARREGEASTWVDLRTHPMWHDFMEYRRKLDAPAYARYVEIHDRALQEAPVYGALSEQEAKLRETHSVTLDLKLDASEIEALLKDWQHGNLEAMPLLPVLPRTLTDAQKYALIEKHLGLHQRRGGTVINRRTGYYTDAQRYFGLIDEGVALAFVTTTQGEPT